MPELPEVETIRTQLSVYLPARVIFVGYSDVSASIVKVKNFSPRNRTIEKINRIGKVMEFVFTGNKFMISQLGMSGAWIVSKEKVVEKHTHVQFKCSNNEGLIYFAYVDPRRFGNMYFFNEAQKKEKLSSLGVDVSTKNLTSDYIYEILKRFPKREIKPLLLEQKLFAGIGNYMASEILGLAGILPERFCKSITKSECEKIRKATKRVIEKSIKTKGLTFAGGYRDATGSKGEALSTLVVFNQTHCQMCKKSAVIKIQQKGRGTYFCPKCQK